MTVLVMLMMIDNLRGCRTSDVVREPQVQLLMRGLLRDARSGFEHREEAVFIVRAASGNYYSIEWPSTGDLDSARWEGKFPEGTVAIAHTHPTHLPNPSNIDATVARNVHVPVYVVTHERITRTDGGEPMIVAQW